MNHAYPMNLLLEEVKNYILVLQAASVYREGLMQKINTKQITAGESPCMLLI